MVSTAGTLRSSLLEVEGEVEIPEDKAFSTLDDVYVCEVNMEVTFMRNSNDNKIIVHTFDFRTRASEVVLIIIVMWSAVST